MNLRPRAGVPHSTRSSIGAPCAAALQASSPPMPMPIATTRRHRSRDEAARGLAEGAGPGVETSVVRRVAVAVTGAGQVEPQRRDASLCEGLCPFAARAVGGHLLPAERRADHHADVRGVARLWHGASPGMAHDCHAEMRDAPVVVTLPLLRVFRCSPWGVSDRSRVSN